MLDLSGSLILHLPSSVIYQNQIIEETFFYYSFSNPCSCLFHRLSINIFINLVPLWDCYFYNTDRIMLFWKKQSVWFVHTFFLQDSFEIEYSKIRRFSFYYLAPLCCPVLLNLFHLVGFILKLVNNFYFRSISIYLDIFLMINTLLSILWLYKKYWRCCPVSFGIFWINLQFFLL